VFNSFATGKNISAIDFFKMCKALKVYPVVVTFETLKKVVLKNPEFWWPTT